MGKSAQRHSSQDDPMFQRASPTPWHTGAILLALVLMVAGCGESVPVQRDVLQLGDPPTRDWPTETPCPNSLADDCAGRALTLVASVNAVGGPLVLCASRVCAGPSDVTVATIGSEAHVLCRWRLTSPGACNLMGAQADSVTGEAAIYAMPTS